MMLLNPGCCCGGEEGGCTIQVACTVWNCSSFEFPGVTVKVYDQSSSGGLLGEAVTDEFGEVLFEVEAIPGHDLVFVASRPPRYAPGTATLTYLEGIGGEGGGHWNCEREVSGAFIQMLTPAAGYVGCCMGMPLKPTLFFTHSIFGSGTVVHNGTTWVGSKSHSYPGYLGCPARTVTVDMAQGCDFANFSWKTVGTAITPTCPDNAGAFGCSFGVSYGAGSVYTDSTYTWTENVTGIGSGCRGRMTNGANHTVSVSE